MQSVTVDDDGQVFQPLGDLVFQQIGDQVYQLENRNRNVPTFVTLGQIINEFVENKQLTDFVRQVTTLQTTAQFEQQQQTQQFRYVQQQLQVNYQEYLKQWNQYMQQLVPFRVPIYQENGQITCVTTNVPRWTLITPMPALVQPSAECFQQMTQQQVMNMYSTGQIQQFYASVQHNQNNVGVEIVQASQQVEQPLNLVVERPQNSDLVNSQSIRDEPQRMQSPAVFMSGLGDGLIN